MSIEGCRNICLFENEKDRPYRNFPSRLNDEVKECWFDLIEFLNICQQNDSRLTIYHSPIKYMLNRKEWYFRYLMDLELEGQGVNGFDKKDFDAVVNKISLIYRKLIIGV